MRYSFSLSPLPRKVCSETNSRNLLFFGELAKCLLSRIRRSSSRFSKREIGRAPGLCKVVNAFYQLQATLAGLARAQITAETISPRGFTVNAIARLSINGYLSRYLPLSGTLEKAQSVIAHRRQAVLRTICGLKNSWKNRRLRRQARCAHLGIPERNRLALLSTM